MKFIPQKNRDQLMLLPPSINDFVDEGHIVRTIDEIVERPACAVSTADRSGSEDMCGVRDNKTWEDFIRWEQTTGLCICQEDQNQGRDREANEQSKRRDTHSISRSRCGR